VAGSFATSIPIVGAAAARAVLRCALPPQEVRHRGLLGLERPVERTLLGGG